MAEIIARPQWEVKVLEHPSIQGTILSDHPSTSKVYTRLIKLAEIIARPQWEDKVLELPPS